MHYACHTKKKNFWTPWNHEHMRVAGNKIKQNVYSKDIYLGRSIGQYCSKFCAAKTPFDSLKKLSRIICIM